MASIRMQMCLLQLLDPTANIAVPLVLRHIHSLLNKFSHVATALAAGSCPAV